MELYDLLRVVRRWIWLIVAVVIVTELALWLGTRSAVQSYTATVGLQISTPQREEVAAFDEYRSISLRDEIAVAINNLLELLQSDEVYSRTTSELHKEGKAVAYAVTAERLRDADFINVTVEAWEPNVAEDIADMHVKVAIAYYGELRSQPTRAEMALFDKQLRQAEEEYQAAEKALLDFRNQNGIFSLDSQLSTQQKLLEQLQLERDKRLLAGATTFIDPVGKVDELIAQRQNELNAFTALVPEYNILQQKAEQARTAYQHLLAKYGEAEVKVTAVQAANFIQVIKSARAPAASESSWPKLALLALVGSLGMGVVLAFLLQSISDFRAADVTVPESEQKMPSREPARRAPSTVLSHDYRNRDLAVEHERAGQVPPAVLDSGAETH